MSIVARLDQYQQRHVWLALPLAVARKVQDDRARDYAALIAYYAFLAIFPLLLILITLLDVLLRNNAGLRNTVLSSALAHYPVIGPELKTVVNPSPQTGIALAIGFITMLFGARRVASAMQHAINSAWGIPLGRRPSGLRAIVRGLALIGVIGTGLIATSALSGLAFTGSRVISLAGSLVLNIAMFWTGFKLAAAPELGWRRLLPGALIGATCWQVLQAIGGYYVVHQLARSSAVYGVFAIVLGLATWLFIQAQLTVWAVEANAVLVYRLWPRSLRPPRTAADRRAYELYAEVEDRHDS